MCGHQRLHLSATVFIFIPLFCAAIERVLDQNSLNMEIIVNNKSLDNVLNVVQLQTAVGAAMKSPVGGLGE